MSEKFTPGPWISKRPNGMVKTPDDVKLIASCYGDDPECHEDERQIANAHLIAAAPQLYEALKMLSGFAKDAATLDYNEDRTLSWIAFVTAQADAALSAARGDGV